MLNTNADTIASETARALAKADNVTLVYCFEKPGVLANPDDDNSVIPTITRSLFQRLTADGTISGGMLPKLASALAAAKNGVHSVHIIDGRVDHCLLLEILTAQGVGTMITADA